MDKTVLLQKQVRDNSEDLRAYLQDLSKWEEDMKRKESQISSNDSEPQVLKSSLTYTIIYTLPLIIFYRYL